MICLKFEFLWIWPFNGQIWANLSTAHLRNLV